MPTATHYPATGRSLRPVADIAKGGVHVWVMAFFDTRQRRDQAAAGLPAGMVDQVYREDPDTPADRAEAPVELSAVEMPVAGPIPPTEPLTGPEVPRADAQYQLAVSTHRPDAVSGWLSQHHARWVELSDAPPR